MTFFDFLTLIGGLSLFLFGMNLMGDALEKRAGNGLKNLLGKLTSSKAAGFLTGVGITAVIPVSYTHLGRTPAERARLPYAAGSP